MLNVGAIPEKVKPAADKSEIPADYDGFAAGSHYISDLRNRIGLPRQGTIGLVSGMFLWLEG